MGDNQKKSGTNWVLYLGIALALYFLSSGPAAYFMKHSYLGSTSFGGRIGNASLGARLFDVFYFPVDCLFEIPFVKNIIGYYVSLWI